MMIERLKSNSGETISEVLVGVLIVGLATVLFATMVNVATSTSLKSVDLTMATYSQLSEVDSGSGVEMDFGPLVIIENASDANADVAFSPISIKVNAMSSTSDDANYIFTRYYMPPVQSPNGSY